VKKPIMMFLWSDFTWKSTQPPYLVICDACNEKEPAQLMLIVLRYGVIKSLSSARCRHKMKLTACVQPERVMVFLVCHHQICLTHGPSTFAALLYVTHISHSRQIWSDKLSTLILISAMGNIFRRACARCIAPIKAEQRSSSFRTRPRIKSKIPLLLLFMPIKARSEFTALTCNKLRADPRRCRTTCRPLAAARAATRRSAGRRPGSRPASTTWTGPGWNCRRSAADEKNIRFHYYTLVLKLRP